MEVWRRALHLSVTEALNNTESYGGWERNIFCFFQTAETGQRTPNSSIKGSGANHHLMAPAQNV